TSTMRWARLDETSPHILMHHFTVPSSDSGGRFFCCFTLISEPIPEEHIIDYYTTHSSCPRHAYVFVTTSFVNLCVDPNQPWVISIKNNLDKKNSPP
uniref:Chemokine interleukin-8-like domain-containing protein n=1 Tax=Salarias fasciatus TaxID=181472 RepID=A0A672H032_SALFA